MASCSFTSTGRTFTLNVSESSYSIENNTSNIYWEINISGGGTQWYDSYCKAIVNGSVVFNETKSWGSGVFPAKDGSVSGYIYNIPHDSEGRASVSFYIEGYSEVYSTKSASGSLPLTTIPRATLAPSITCDVENTTSFTLTPYASFSHSVSINFGTINKYLKTDGTLSDSEVKYDTGTRTWSFNADKSYYKQFNKKSGQGGITVRTYSGSTLVGSKSGTLTIVANQALCSPVITGTVVDINETTKALTGDENVIIKYKSTPRLTTQIQITSPNDNNSTLSYLQVAGNNISDLTQRVFDVQNPTQNSFIVKAINSRDYSTETPLSSTGTFIDYILPTITITSAKRTEPTTGDATIEYKGDYYNGKFSKTTSNELVVTWKYKEKGIEEYTNGGTITPTIKDNTFSGTINVDGLFNYKKQYNIIVIVTDKLSSTQSVAQIPRGFPIFWWSENFVDILGELRINGNNPFLYSEDETVIGKWYDGKPLYQKIIIHDSGCSATVNNRHAHGIENVDTIFIKHAFIQSTKANKLTYMLPVTQYGSNTEHDELSVCIDTTYYEFLVQSGWGGENWHIFMIVNYTKVTDSVANLMIEDETKPTKTI
jgi:hypothetical protein|nr:MAG TPA: protein of unknown function DUF859 [Caudoviricetes sp.]